MSTKPISRMDERASNNLEHVTKACMKATQERRAKEIETSDVAYSRLGVHTTFSGSTVQPFPRMEPSSRSVKREKHININI
jgi:hypothetical protein